MLEPDDPLSKLREGIKEWNSWRVRAGILAPNLSGADLRGVNLCGANLHFADLRDADLRGADLTDADLDTTSLGAANLSGADLTRASVNWAALGEVNLSGANLELASFNWSGLIGANLSHAVLRETVFGATNLRNAQGLDTCLHEGPSILDYRTLAISGPLPLSFLRGCGLPDEFIEYLPSLLNQAIQFYSCFISYSTMGQAFADRLYADLQNKGVRCWFAPHDLHGGRKLHEQIDEAIRVYDRLLLILSEASMNSEWVKTEIANARKRELREHRRMLFPVRLADFATLRDWQCFDADSGKGFRPRDSRIFYPGFQRLEEPR